MKTITFRKKGYEIPESWEEITLGMQIKVSDIAHEQQYVKTIAILAGYTGIPLQELKTAKVHELTRVMKALAFISTPIPDDPIFEFTFNGNNYIIATNITSQEFQDYVSIQTAISENKDNRWKVTPIILAVMSKKSVDESIDDYDIMERAKQFEGINVVTANRIAAFFLSQTQVSEFIMMYSSQEAQENILQSKVQELNTSIAKLRKHRGGNLLIRLWVMILRKYTKFISKQSEKFYSSLPSNN